MLGPGKKREYFAIRFSDDPCCSQGKHASRNLLTFTAARANVTVWCQGSEVI